MDRFAERLKFDVANRKLFAHVDVLYCLENNIKVSGEVVGSKHTWLTCFATIDLARRPCHDRQSRELVKCLLSKLFVPESLSKSLHHHQRRQRHDGIVSRKLLLHPSRSGQIVLRVDDLWGEIGIYGQRDRHVGQASIRVVEHLLSGLLHVRSGETFQSRKCPAHLQTYTQISLSESHLSWLLCRRHLQVWQLCLGREASAKD